MPSTGSTPTSASAPASAPAALGPTPSDLPPSLTSLDALNGAPSMPTTFLPSYYPETRNDLLPSYVSRPDAYDRASTHLLDGIDLSEQVTQSPHRVLQHSLPPTSLPSSPMARPWQPKDAGPWREVPLYSDDCREVSADDYAQVSLALDARSEALGLYEHLLAAIPHIQANDGGGSIQPLLALAAEGVALLAPPTPHTSSSPLERPKPTTHPPPGPGGLASVGVGTKRAREAKDTPVCLGCGATETPEWRRGPLGPRTLCNACGLVHMKMVRKKRKQEEAQKKQQQQS